VSRPWAAGAATGIGSLPGTDAAEAARLVFGELPDLPHLAELPQRGAGADMIGRTAALLVDLPVEIVASGWRLAARPGVDLGRARDFLARDLDALQAQAEAHAGALKVQAAGPWTLAAALELPSGHRAVSDHGATREIVESLGEGLRLHLAEVTRRVPGCRPVLQLDEPSLPSVLAGAVPTPSGYGTVPAVAAGVVRDAIQDVLARAPEGARVVHCCAADVPIALLRAAGADAVAVDASLLDTGHNDRLGEAVEAGTSLWLGVLPTADGAVVSPELAIETIRRLWRELGFPESRLPASVVATPACGLAGASPEHARRALAALRAITARLRDLG
jgi:methionine synthase II (cobalamin-independent)